MNADSPGARDASRHLSIEGVKEYVRSGAPGMLQIDGEPSGFLIIEPATSRLAIQLLVDDELPNCSRFQNVHVARVRRDVGDWNEVSVEAGDHLEDLYPLLCQILDRVQLEGQTFSTAVLEVLRIYQDVLRDRTSLSENMQVGLFGELLILEHLCNRIGTVAAMASWLGPSNEEHDFSLDAGDLEVKTTTSETRAHWISTATQLAPTEGKVLNLVSIQLTRAGAAKGRTLPELVAAVSARSIECESSYQDLLGRVGYRQTEADLYPTRWTLRTKPVSFVVDDDFPALTGEALEASVHQASRIIDVRYRIDLTGFPMSSGPKVLLGLIETSTETR